MISILVTLALIGLVVWLVETYIPMAPGFKKLFEVVAIVGTVLWLLDVSGLYHFPGHF